MALGRPVYNPSPAIATSIAQRSGMVAPTQTDLTDWQDVIRTDPNLQRITSPEARTNYLRATWGLPNSYKVDAQGNITDAHGWLARNLWWVAPAALVGGSAIGAAAAGGGAPAATAGTTAATTGGGLTPAMTAAPAAIASQGASATGAGMAGIWDTVAKYAPKLLDMGDLLGSAAKGQQAGRQNDNLIAARIFDSLTSGANNQFNADKYRYEAARDAPAIRAKQAAMGDVLANVQDVRIGRPSGSTVPTFSYSGGLRPSALGPNARAAGGEMSRKALLAMMAGEDLPTYKAPIAPTMDKGGWLEDALSLGGLFAGGAGRLFAPSVPGVSQPHKSVPQEQLGEAPFRERPWWENEDEELGD